MFQRSIRPLSQSDAILTDAAAAAPASTERCIANSFPGVCHRAFSGLRPAVALLIACGIVLCSVAGAQTHEWTWMGGNNTDWQYGVYGTLGTPAAGNTPGGRWLAASWTDSSGHLWLFGGGAVETTLWEFNDLWEFNPSTNEWAWMGGSGTALYWNNNPCVNPNGCGVAGTYGTLGTPAAGNLPGSRQGASTWTDSSGHLWLFGGWGYDASGNWGDFNDLWKFNPSTNQWAWMGGSNTVSLMPNGGYGQPGVYGTVGVPTAGNIPSGRQGAASWTDSSGNLWLFGGQGPAASGTWGDGGAGSGSNGNWGELNDLWEFNPQTNEWTWMGGSSTAGSNGGQPGVYGTLGTPAARNIPGSRENAVVWTDSSHNIWLLGGYGYDANSTEGALNDLWEFNPTSNQWAWIGGSSTVPCSGCGRPGVYGISEAAAAGNIPGGRYGAGSWTDSGGHLWLLGGQGLDANGNWGFLNDLWEFNPSTSQWAWMGGSSTGGSNGGQLGVYGTLGTPAAGNIPGGRQYAASWTDCNNNFWLFGGYGFDIIGNYGGLNDLWKYQPYPTAVTPTFNPAAGTYTTAQSVTITDAIAGSAIYYTTDGTDPTSASSVYGGPIEVNSTEMIKAIAVATGYTTSAVASATYTLTPNAFLAPSSLNFVNQTVGVASSAQSVSLDNYSNVVMSISDIGIVGTNASAFSQTSNCGGTLAGYSSCTIWVTFTPLSAGSFSATLSVADNASGSPQTIPLTGNANGPSALLTPSTLTFGNQTVYSTSSPWTVNLTNNSNSTLTVSGSSIIGANPADFSIQSQTCGTTLTANSSCSIYVTFTPASVGSFTATLAIADNASGSPQTVPLSGTGTALDAFLAPNNLNFVNQTVGVTSSAQQVLLDNASNGSLTIYGFSFAGINPGAFSQTNNCGSTLAGNSTCTIWVTFTAPSAGSFSATMSASTNATIGQQTINLTGNANGPSALLTPSTLTFGNQTVYSTSSPWTVNLTNNSNSTLTISGISIIGANPADFSIQSQTCGTTLAANSSCSIYVIFTPASVGSFTATLAVADNASGSPQTVPLSGTGTAINAFLTPSSLNFVNQTVGVASSAQAVSLDNSSNGSMTISGISIVGTNASAFSQTSNCGSALAGNSSCAIWVTFTPPSAGSFSATLSVADNASGSPQTIPLNGNAISLPAAATPTFSPAAGTYFTAQSVTINDATAGAFIFYTTNGTTPTTSSTVYSGPITVSATETLEAIAVASGYSTSTVASATYTINLPQAATPTFSPAAGTYSTAQTVTISDATAGAVIYYTTNGTTPTASSSVYSGPITVSSSETLDAIATATGYTPSAVATAAYTITTNNTPAVPTEPVGTSSGTLTATVSLTSSFTLGLIGVITQGAPNLDFRFASGGTCMVGIAYTAGQTCTVNYTFKPTTPGMRMGAILLYDNTTPTPVLQSTTYVSGIGTGPLAAFSPGIITTIAGNGATGYNGDGYPATSFELYGPIGLASDAVGNLYIADQGNERIRKLTPGGTISTIAGSGTQGFGGDGGAATGAEFNWPDKVAIDGADNLYIVDQFNYRIRMVSPDGTIRTVAGGGSSYPGDGGPATSALLNWPQGIAVDGAGNFYISEVSGNRVRKVTPDGTIRTVAGNGNQGYSGDNGPATSAELNYPTDLALDATGNLYISDDWNNVVRKVDLTGTITTVAGNGIQGYGGDNGPATRAELYYPQGLAIDAAGNLYISDTDNDRIRKVDLTGTITTVVGNGSQGYGGDNGPATSAVLYYPESMAFDGVGNLYFVDSATRRVRKVDVSDTPSLTFAATNVGSTSSDSPQAVTLENIGNAALTFPIPSSGNNPTITSNFTLNSSSALDCPLVSSTTSTAGTLMVGANCLLPVNFVPTTAGTINGSLVLIDNNLNERNVTQTISLNGTGTAQAATPTFTPAAGTYSTAQTVAISDVTPGATIYYTTDGTTPTTSSSVYSGPFTVSSSETLEAIATASGYSTSTVATAAYTITTPASASMPVFSIDGGIYSSAQTVTISDSTPGATIYYTTDSSTPTTSSNVYSGPITVSGWETLEAMAVATGYEMSPVNAANYVVTLGSGWVDNFESYSVGSFPSPSWTPSGNNGTNVVNSTWFSPTQSAQLYGQVGGCWAALIYRQLTVTPPYTVEYFAKNGTESLNGCHPKRASAELKTSSDWTSGGRTIAVFDSSGNFDDANGSQGPNFPLNTWVKVRILYEMPNASTVRLTYWLNDQYYESILVPANSFDSQLAYLSLGSQEGTSWFDDVSVTSGLPNMPSLTVASTHTGNFTQGGNGVYTVTVGNAVGAQPTSGTITMTENLPSGLTLDSMSGTGWTCSAPTSTCTRGDVLSPGSSYPPITVTVNVSASTPSSVTNQVTATGGGSPIAFASDTTTILQPQTINFILASPVTFGVAPITLSATATSGLTVTFSVQSGPAMVNSNLLTITGAGTVVVAADQAGNAVYSAAPQVIQTLTVTAATTALALSSTPGPGTIPLGTSITLQATLSPSAIGTANTNGDSVTFYNGTTVLGTGTLAGGVATLSLSNLPLGVDSVTASYGGDTNFGASVSGATIFTVVPRAPTSITLTAGGNQSTYVGTAFATPLQVTVANGGIPVSGATVTFAVPSNGASTTLSSQTAMTDANGQASVTATANASPGSYSVVASVSGVTQTASIALINTTMPTYTVTTLTDDAAGVASNCNDTSSSTTPNANCSLRDAIAAASAIPQSTATPVPTNLMPTINFASSLNLSVANPGAYSLSSTLSNNMNIVGPGANLLTVSGETFGINSGASVSISSLTLSANCGDIYVRCIANGGTLMVTNSTFIVSVGGIAFNWGIDNLGSGSMTVVNSTLITNVAAPYANGISNQGALTVAYSTLVSNAGFSFDFGIDNEGTLTVSDSTLFTNVNYGISDHGISNTGTLAATNSILAPWCEGCGALSNTITGVGPQLAPLGYYGGPTQTMPPLPGSPAICAGLASNLQAGVMTDQRGYPNTNASYTGYSASAPCVDAGAVQTNYSLAFTTQPSPIAPAAAILPNADFQAAVTLDESGMPFVPGVTIPLTLNTTSNGTLSGGSATTSNGMATYSSLHVGAAGTGDTLTASLALNPAIAAAPPAISAVSSSFTIAQLTPTVTWVTPTPIVYGTALSATQLNATASVSGTFVYAPSANAVLGAGSQVLSVTFTPTDSTNYATVTTTVTLIVNQATPTVTLSTTSNPVLMQNAITLTATVSAANTSAPTGTVTFSAGSSPLGISRLNASGVATLTTSALPVGTTQVTAIYAGDTNFTAATSGTLSEEVDDFNLTVPVTGGTSSTPTVTAQPGGVAVFTFTVTPTGGTFPSDITLTASGLPTGATYSFSPPTLTAGSGATTVTLTVQLPQGITQSAIEPAARGEGRSLARNDAHHRTHGGIGSKLAPLALALLLLPFAGRLRKTRKRLGRWMSVLLLLAAMGAVTGLSGCQWLSGVLGSSYNVSVTATSGSLSHSTVFTLKVE